jgi:dienelactone hydrolase
MRLALRLLALVLAVAFILLLVRIVALENGGPAHQPFELPGHEPATLYLPGGGNPFYRLFPLPKEQRPPCVVLMHGFTSDRVMMSVLARRLAQNGYAVVAIDAHGHGTNRNPFQDDQLGNSAFLQDLGNAVEFLRNYRFVDGSRIVVMGHSMGAGATYNYATHDASIKGAVMISGGWGGSGNERPRNALFIFAQNDPKEAIQDTSKQLAAHLAGVPQAELGKTYGDFAQGTAVEAIEIPGESHVSMVFSEKAADTIVKWADSATATPRTGAINMSDPRMAISRIALLVFLILLVPIGRVCGAMVPRWADRAGGANAWAGLVVLAAAMFIAMPLVAATPPAMFLSLVVGDLQVSWFFVAGLLMLAGLTFSNHLDWIAIRDGSRGVALGAIFGIAATYVPQIPMQMTFHNFALTPERLVAAILAAVLLLPFWLAFELILRRGSVVMSTLTAALGRVLILVLIWAGVMLHVVPFVVILILPILAIIFLTFEVFAASAYATSRNLVLIAVVESAWFAWTIAASNPITFMF